MQIKQTIKRLEYMFDDAKNRIVKALAPIGPTKLMIYGSLLASEAWYIRGREILQKDLVGSTVSYFATAPITTLAEALFLTGFCMAADNSVKYVKKTVKNIQKAQRAKRLYSAWKTSPSYQPVLEHI